MLLCRASHRCRNSQVPIPARWAHLDSASSAWVSSSNCSKSSSSSVCWCSWGRIGSSSGSALAPRSSPSHATLHVIGNPLACGSVRCLLPPSSAPSRRLSCVSCCLAVSVGWCLSGRNRVRCWWVVRHCIIWSWCLRWRCSCEAVSHFACLRSDFLYELGGTEFAEMKHSSLICLKTASTRLGRTAFTALSAFSCDLRLHLIFLSNLADSRTLPFITASILLNLRKLGVTFLCLTFSCKFIDIFNIIFIWSELSRVSFEGHLHQWFVVVDQCMEVVLLGVCSGKGTHLVGDQEVDYLFAVGLADSQDFGWGRERGKVGLDWDVAHLCEGFWGREGLHLDALGDFRDILLGELGREGGLLGDGRLKIWVASGLSLRVSFLLHFILDCFVPLG